jgi:hypothetical protein
MTARESRRHDDGADDPNNPLVPFRMSDRLAIYGLQLQMRWVLGGILVIAGLVGSGMALHFLG